MGVETIRKPADTRVAVKPAFDLALRMGDNALILAQRNAAWCGHAPALEEDIALANVALDLIGQAKLWLGYAGELEGEDRSADDLAFLRDGRDFQNVLLVETPNGDFGQTTMRQWLYDSWHHFMLEGLKASSDERIVEIAEKSAKEVAYHLERSTDLVIRLGDGTDESHRRMQDALDYLWPFALELDVADDADRAIAAAGIGPDLAGVAQKAQAYRSEALSQAMLVAPTDSVPRKGGKAGVHSEAFGFMLAEMQVLQRTHPGVKW